MMNKFITLLTDFGEEDWFVGSMKGVIASICPGAKTIDITHLIPPGDIRRGAFALKCAYRYFPPGTVNMAIVDPGVGSDRGILVVRGGGYIFVAPDNGLLSYILAELKDKAVYHATRKDLFLDEASNTFHGRDIFAPLAAHLAGGISADQVGPVCPEPITFPLPNCRPAGNNSWEAEIITIDKFGNCITSIPVEKIRFISGLTRSTGIRIVVKNEEIYLPIVESYSAGEEGMPLAIPGSCGFLELAVNGDNAAQRLDLHSGDRIEITIE
jgi:S-adenosyl-L-methionine hydrolase (adenosine-forming)